MARWLWPLVALAGCASPAGPVGHAETVAALDDGAAIVLWRDDGKGQDHLVRVDGAGKRAWDTKLDGLPRLTPPIVAGDLVLVRHHHVTSYGVGQQAIAAYAVADGKRRWDVELAAYTGARGAGGTPVPPTYLDVTVVEDKLVVWTGNELGRDVGAVILDRGGQIVARAQAGIDDPGTPVVVGTRVITHSGRQISILDTATGGVQQAEIAGRGCAVKDDYVVLDDPTLIALPGGDPAKRVTLAMPFRPDVSDPQVMVSCAQHAGRLVAAVIRPDAADVVIGDKVVPMPEAELSIDEDAERYGVGPFQGELPRFMPFVAEPSSGDRSHLRVLDLEAGAIAWDAPYDPLAAMTTLFRAGTSWYLALDGEVKRIDGATGEPVAGAYASHDDGLGTVRPASLAGGRLWLTAKFKGPLDQMAIAALDAETLAPVFTRRIEVHDLTAESRAVLGRE